MVAAGFLAGAVAGTVAGAASGAAGVFAAAFGVAAAGIDRFIMIDFWVRLVDMYARVWDVCMKIMATAVLALPRNVDAPLLPNSVWLPPPPNAAPISAPFPV